MRPTALAEAITHLAWLCPSASSLTALARSSSAAVWSEVRSDPGAVLLLLRQAGATGANSSRFCLSAILADPSLPERALALLDDPGAGFVDWSRPGPRHIHERCLKYAHLAHLVALSTKQCHEDCAWSAGLLAPLGWLASCAIDPAETLAIIEDAQWKSNPTATQHRHWSCDQAALARRLGRRWLLPSWLSAVAGHLGLPGEVALALGADLDLFRVVSVAVLLVQEQDQGLALPVGSTLAELSKALALSAADLDRLRADARAPLDTVSASPSWQSPKTQPLMRDLLALAAENRRLRNAPILRQVEENLDALHRAFEDLRAGEADRLQYLKLTALAEFAAGAGHEINNPLAVISGQAQYLLGHETDAGRQRSLQIIINHSQRIHQILRDVMHFARPPHPHKQPIDLPDLMREAALSLHDLALERRVRVLCPEPPSGLALEADAAQMRTALTCLLRNAIEAAPIDGWAAIRLETPSADQVDVVFEDSGPGLTPGQCEHLFDPFYSGRQAGRGRGLGLPTAWRLAHAHGGDLRYVGLPEGPTRFVLRLPRQIPMTNGTH